MRSTSLASSPAHASARAAATCESSIPVTCETRRSRIPVRDVIHASSVSMSDARSALVRTDGGMHLPHPVTAAYVMRLDAGAARCVLPRPESLRRPIRGSSLFPRLRRGFGVAGRPIGWIFVLLVVADHALDGARREHWTLPATDGNGNRAKGHATSPW